MKRVLRLTLGLVGFLLLLGVGGILFLDSLVVQAIERGGSHALGVETHLAKADLGVLSGDFALHGLHVSNPPGFREPDFFTLATARLELPLSTLRADLITIPELRLEGIRLDLERNSQGTNYGAILEHLERFDSRPSAREAPEEGERHEGTRFVLERLLIRDVHASVNLVPAGGDLTKLSLSIPEIVVEELSNEMTLAQICALVVRTVVQAAMRSSDLPQELLADLRARLGAFEGDARAKLDEGLGRLEDGLGEQAKKLGPEAEKALKEASGKLGERLDGLFKKKD